MTITVTLPATFLARDVQMTIVQTDKGFSVVAVDAVGNPWPIEWKGMSAPILENLSTREAAGYMLEAMGAREGTRIFATPAVRF
jgi:hypothetical protein